MIPSAYSFGDFLTPKMASKLLCFLPTLQQPPKLTVANDVPLLVIKRLGSILFLSHIAITSSLSSNMKAKINSFFFLSLLLWRQTVWNSAQLRPFNNIPCESCLLSKQQRSISADKEKKIMIHPSGFCEWMGEKK